MTIKIFQTNNLELHSLILNKVILYSRTKILKKGLAHKNKINFKFNKNFKKTL